MKCACACKEKDGCTYWTFNHKNERKCYVKFVKDEENKSSQGCRGQLWNIRNTG